jgi:glycerol-3-phosphate dehydrogenase
MKTINESIVEKVAAVMQKELDWTEAKKAQRIMDYTDHWKTLHPLTKS